MTPVQHLSWKFTIHRKRRSMGLPRKILFDAAQTIRLRMLTQNSASPNYLQRLPHPLVVRDVQCIGRLDEDTTGLILISMMANLSTAWVPQTQSTQNLRSHLQTPRQRWTNRAYFKRRTTNWWRWANRCTSLRKNQRKRDSHDFGRRQIPPSKTHGRRN